MSADKPHRVTHWCIRTLLRAGWAPIVVFTAHMLASKVFHVYHQFPNFDIPMHLSGGLAIAYFFHVGSRQGSTLKVLGPYHVVTHCLLVFSLSCTAAVFWEFAEFLSDRYLGTRMQAGDLNDTLLDILLGMVGALIWLLVAGICGRLTPSNNSMNA